MKNLTKIEADLLALEIVATAIAGVSFEGTNDAITYCISKNLEVDTSSVSVGMSSMFLNSQDTFGYPTCVVKLCFHNFGKWDLWAPTLKINSSSIEDESVRLAKWLYDMTNVDHDVDYDVILED